MIETVNKLLREATAAFTQGEDAYAKGVLAALDIIEEDRKAEWENMLSLLATAAPDSLPEPEPEEEGGPERLSGEGSTDIWYRTINGKYECECCLYGTATSLQSLVDDYGEIVSVPLPPRVADVDGDEWTLGDDGLYKCGSSATASYARVWELYGPLTLM